VSRFSPVAMAVFNDDLLTEGARNDAERRCDAGTQSLRNRYLPTAAIRGGPPQSLERQKTAPDTPGRIMVNSPAKAWW